MHSPFRTKGVILAGLLALALAAVTPTFAAAKPEPGAKKPRGFRLLAAPLGAMTINNIYCGLNSTGEVCVDSTNSSTIGGGFWPKGSADQYIFNSGLQLAGIVSGGPWDGDTTGAFFFDPKGTTQHGIGIENIVNSTSSSDLANWPGAAYVPSSSNDAGGANFNALLQGRKVASQGDVWFMSWEGDPGQNAGRKHPLGVAVETRGMGWNFPTGNQDILYFIYTFYNITSTNPADYVNIRPDMQSILLSAASDFQAKNNAAFNVSLPSGGYTIDNLFAAFATDMDVAQADVNYASVNLPFALGYTYVQNFAGTASWTFPSTIFTGPTFFAGAGFAGIKYLKSPTGPGAIQLYSNTVNQSGFFNDPANTIQLYRYLSGNISVPAGDQPCNTGNPTITHICFINNTTARDMRFFQSSTALSLPPGGQGSIVVAYIFAPPVSVPGCPTAGGTCGGGDLKPGSPDKLGTVTGMAGGVNLVDSVAGYLSHSDLDLDGLVEQEGTNGPEWTVVPGSLLGKSYTAQAVFDARFLLPFAPESPEFFLIPGNNQVTVIWRPTASEQLGDAYYSITSDPNSALYDPNYRQFDVEGYRIYRGRVDSPDQLFLIKQFDFAGTVFTDYDGTVNPVDGCAPEFGVMIDCPVTFQAPAPGVPRTIGYDYNIISDFVQTRYGDRLLLASGIAYTAKADTAVTGGNSGLPKLDDTGIPYSYVDNTVRNNFRYFYVVTAFDINSYASGPSSLESSKASTISVVPQAPATNVISQLGTTTQILYGQRNNIPLTTTNQYTTFPSVPTIDATNGTFSGPQPPATFTVGFAAVVTQVLGDVGSFSARLDSLQLGQTDLSGCCGGADPRGGIPAVYYYRLGNATDSIKVAVSLLQDLAANVTTDVFMPGPSIDPDLATIYGGDSTFTSMLAKFTPVLASEPQSGDQGLGAALDEPGFAPADFPTGTSGVNYNGARWFDGPSPSSPETAANPTAGSCSTGDGGGACAANGTPNFNNAGTLSGVANINMPMGYSMFNREWRNVTATQAGARRAADYNVYWGAPGVVDSVIDVTHNVPVDFDGDTVGGGWAILNTTGQGAGGFDNRPTVLTPTDWTCVEPFRSLQPAVGFFPCGSAAPFNLDNVATLGAIAYGSGDNQSASATRSVRNPANIQANNGFMMYLAGTITGFDMTTLPTNTVWSLRDYVGSIYGGSGGVGGNVGPYTFRSGPRPFTAIGATMVFQYTVTNTTTAPTNAGLAQIHTIPDPYYVTNEYESDFTAKVIKFVNLPTNAIIRIYSSSGVLVRVLNYTSPENGGMLDWNVRNRTNQVVASGVYFYHVEAGDARFIGRMTIINFAQ